MPFVVDNLSPEARRLGDDEDPRRVAGRRRSESKPTDDMVTQLGRAATASERSTDKATKRSVKSTLANSLKCHIESSYHSGTHSFIELKTIMRLLDQNVNFVGLSSSGSLFVAHSHVRRGRKCDAALAAEVSSLRMASYCGTRHPHRLLLLRHHRPQNFHDESPCL